VSTILQSIRDEYLRYKTLSERAIAQLPDEQLSAAGPAGGNSIAIVCWHVSGNLRSRFTDFLTTDGEKPWRKRDEEFEPRAVTRAELLAKWEDGWQVLLTTLDALTPADLDRQVVIRGEAMSVHQALLRSVTHASYHAGQIVYIAKSVRGAAWQYLSIPPRPSP
jgi:uncharacterized damage-inducible protein DinB